MLRVTIQKYLFLLVNDRLEMLGYPFFVVGKKITFLEMIKESTRKVVQDEIVSRLTFVSVITTSIKNASPVGAVEAVLCLNVHSLLLLSTQLNCALCVSNKNTLLL